MTTNLLDAPNDKPVGLDVERHNAWVEQLKADVEFPPLLEFLDRLKELPRNDAGTIPP